MALFPVQQQPEIERPRLDLSGPRLRNALESLIDGSEAQGGVERYVDAIKLKASLFQDALHDPAELELEQFKALCTFMSTVRRRVSAWLEEPDYSTMREAIMELFDGASDTTTTDERVAAFCAKFPQDKQHRWVRDVAAELLHNADPERYPMMTRWIWDAKANTGVLREIWHGHDVDHITIGVRDGYATFVMLREELAQFLSDNGVFRDTLHYVDLLCAQVYAQYICEQGGSYLRTDFAAPEDPMQHTRRLLGLDGVKAGTNRTRLKAIDGEAFVLDDVKLIDENPSES